MSSFFSQLASSGFNFTKWLLIGIAAELAIFVYAYWLFPEQPNEIFRHAARYSGRMALFIYLFAFSFFAATFTDKHPGVLTTLKKIVTIFCVLHLIHFGFLATNVILNEIELVIVIIGTYLARIKGDFPGVEPGPVHYFGIGATVLALLVYGWVIFRARPLVQGEG